MTVVERHFFKINSEDGKSFALRLNDDGTATLEGDLSPKEAWEIAFGQRDRDFA